MTGESERGAVSTFIAVIFMAVLAGAAGLVVDGGRKVTALTEANHLAEAAARAGAQAIDIDHFRTTGEIAVIPDAANQYVADYLAAVGHPGTTAVSGATVTVTVTITVNPALLPISPMTATATQTATATTEDPNP